MALIKIYWERNSSVGISSGVLPIECSEEDVPATIEIYKKKCLKEEYGRKIVKVQVYKLLNEEEL
jgi:hypothetical protein